MHGQAQNYLLQILPFFSDTMCWFGPWQGYFGASGALLELMTRMKGEDGEATD